MYHKCAFSWASQSVSVFNFSALGGPREEMRKDSPGKSLLLKRADLKEFDNFYGRDHKSHPVAPSPLLIVRPWEGSEGLVMVVGRPWWVEAPVEAQI